MARPFLSEAERAILHELLLFFDAVSDDFLPRQHASALNRLLRLGLVAKHRVRLSLPKMGGPLFSFPSGGSPETPGHVAWVLSKRWNSLNPRSLILYSATPQATKLLGGRKGRIRNPHHLEHDLAVAATYYFLCPSRLQANSASWIPERQVSSLLPGISVLFDALLIDPQRTPFLAIEIGGRYSKRRIQALCLAARQQRIPLEIW